MTKSIYVDAIAPEHTHTSCSDDYLYNAAYSTDDHDGYGRCYRCTLLMAALNGEHGTYGIAYDEDGEE